MSLTILPAAGLAIMLNAITIMIVVAHKHPVTSPHHLSHPPARQPLGLGWTLLLVSPLLVCAVLLLGALISLSSRPRYY